MMSKLWFLLSGSHYPGGKTSKWASSEGMARAMIKFESARALGENVWDIIGIKGILGSLLNGLDINWGISK